MHDRSVPQAVREAYQQLWQVLQAAGSGDLQAEQQRCQQALEQNPHDVVAWNRLALLAEQCSRPALAEVLFRFAVTLNDTVAILHGNLGNILKAQGKYQEALASYQRALQLDPRMAEYYLSVAEIYRLEGEDEREIQCLRGAIEQCPEDATLLVCLGEAVKRRGETQEALDFFRRALALSPTEGYIHQTLAHTKRFTERDADIERMEQLLEWEDLGQEDRTRLNFALGKAYEDLADYERSFPYYQKGNALQRASYEYSIESDARLFSAVMDEFNEELFASHHGGGCDSKAPIFILGMPRSGTTLMEQMLAAHPLVYGAGELPLLTNIVHAIWSRNVTPPGAAYPAAVRSVDAAVLRDAGRYYANAVSESMGKKSGAVHVTDKMPHNFLYLGMIKLLLPNARVIHCRRDPVDTCFSCYKHLFSGQHPYAYDLEELGRYYALYRRLMAHWHAVLPGFILDVDYEAVVADQAGQLERMLTFCDLPWDESCLSYHETGRVAITASSVQVKQPLYKSSVGYWRRYEAHLGPLLEALAS